MAKILKRTLSLCLAALMLMSLLVACNDEDIPDGYKLVACEGDEFRLLVPTSWISNTESGITGASSSVDENASVRVYLADGKGNMTAAEYVDECEVLYSECFEGYESISRDDKYSLGGKRATAIEFSVMKAVTSDDIADNVDKVKTEKYKYMQVSAVFEDEMYSLIFGASEKAYDDNISVFKGEDNEDGDFAGIVPYFEFTGDKYYTEDEKKFSSKVECPENMKLVSTEERPYRFFVPENWQPDYKSMLSAAYYSEGDRSNVSLQGHMLALDDMKLEDYVRQSEKKYENLYGENFKRISFDDTQKMGEHDAYRCTYEVKSGDETYLILQSVTIKGAMAYVFTYTSTTELFDTHMSDVEKMLTEFEIR